MNETIVAHLARNKTKTKLYENKVPFEGKIQQTNS